MDLKLREGQSIAKHLNDFKGIIVQLSVAGLSLDDETFATRLITRQLEHFGGVFGKFSP